MPQRERRHRRILDLLANGPVASQEALQELLAAEGLIATQATLSRDLRELRTVKGPEGYTLPGPGVRAAVPAAGSARPGSAPSIAAGAGRAERVVRGAAQNGQPGPVRKPLPVPALLASVVRDFVLGVTVAAGIVVVRTGPGHAQLVALEFDRAAVEGVAGTIAGDDTVFVAVVDGAAGQRLAEALDALIGVAA